jgi:cytochrome c556
MKSCMPLLLLLLLSFPSSAEDPPVAGTQIGPDPHIVQSARLREIMRRMNLLIYEREHTQLELELIRARHLRALTDAAQDLAMAAENLPDSTGISRLESERQETFRALALKLYTNAVAVQAQAEAADFRALEDSYRRLTETCNTCHELYRGW